MPYAKPQRTADAYAAAFASAARLDYPEVTEYERRAGYAVDRERLESAARTLACPLKVNPPHWQHGRVLYAAARERLARMDEWDGELTLLDIGTAKGFSAVVLAWASADCGQKICVDTVDVIDPSARVARNSVAELECALTVREFIEPHLQGVQVPVHLHGTGSQLLLPTLALANVKVPVAFVDGKHRADVVTEEARWLDQLQDAGDVIVYDDLQMEPLCDAVQTACQAHGYQLQVIAAPPRLYGVATKR